MWKRAGEGSRDSAQLLSAHIPFRRVQIASSRGVGPFGDEAAEPTMRMREDVPPLSES